MLDIFFSCRNASSQVIVASRAAEDFKRLCEHEEVSSFIPPVVSRHQDQHHCVQKKDGRSLASSSFRMKGSINAIRGLRILIVDDDRSPATMNWMKMVLERLPAGHTVDTAHTNYEVLSKLIEPITKYDMVLMTVNMPLKTGIEIVAACRQLEKSHRKQDTLLIIGMCAFNDPMVRQMALFAGMDDVILKPFDLETLMSRVGALRADLVIKKPNAYVKQETITSTKLVMMYPPSAPHELVTTIDDKDSFDSQDLTRPTEPTLTAPFLRRLH